MGQNSAVLMCSLRVCENICDPPLSVYKVHSMRKDTAEYLASHGLKGAAFTIRAADLKDDLFGTLFPCPVEISVEGDSSSTLLPPKRPLEDAGTHSAKSCKLEFDGGSKENPGQAGAGAILRADDGSMICRLRKGLGKSTNRSAKKFLASSPGNFQILASSLGELMLEPYLSSNNLSDSVNENSTTSQQDCASFVIIFTRTQSSKLYNQ